MARVFLDDDLLEWEAYVSGGQPDTERTARIYFHCLSERDRRPRFTPHQSGDVAATQRALLSMPDAELVALLKVADPLS